MGKEQSGMKKLISALLALTMPLSVPVYVSDSCGNETVYTVTLTAGSGRDSREGRIFGRGR